MSLLNKIFGSSKENNSNETEKEVTNSPEPKFYAFTSMDEFENIDAISNDKPVVVFKHSTRCSISRFALKQFDANFNYPDNKMDWYLLDLLNHRDISNEITRRYNIEHQSPQIVVIRNGKAVYSASHDAIDANDLKQFT